MQQTPLVLPPACLSPGSGRAASHAKPHTTGLSCNRTPIWKPRALELSCHGTPIQKPKSPSPSDRSLSWGSSGCLLQAAHCSSFARAWLSAWALGTHFFSGHSSANPSCQGPGRYCFGRGGCVVCPGTPRRNGHRQLVRAGMPVSDTIPPAGTGSVRELAVSCDLCPWVLSGTCSYPEFVCSFFQLRAHILENLWCAGL